jgi:hypothetical protein
VDDRLTDMFRSFAGVLSTQLWQTLTKHMVSLFSNRVRYFTRSDEEHVLLFSADDLGL